MKQWTKENLPGKLMAVLRKGSTTIKLKPLNSTKECAACTWDEDGNINIEIDPFQCAILRGVVHELLHYVFEDSHNAQMDYWTEEPQINGLEEELVSHIRKHPAMYRSWKRTINRKLGRKV